MTLEAYAPPRDPMAKLRRRLTQWDAARPAMLRFDTPMLSISFDDFPVSAAVEGARILESHGARGTYYASAGLADTDGPCGRNFSAADLRRLIADSHEIGCHSFEHGDCAQRDVFETLQDLAKNRDALADMGADASLTTLAYPYGETTTDLKRTLPPRFACARGIFPGLNQGRTDLTQLRAYAMFGKPFSAMREALKRAARRNAWVIGFTHDVSESPTPWGTSAADLDALLQEAHTLGFTVLPVSAALGRRVA